MVESTPAAAAPAAAAPFSLAIQTPLGTTVSLQQVVLVETVLTVRQLISDVPSLACYTCYQLELKQADGWLAMNNYAELHEFEAQGIHLPGSLLRMRLQPYDMRTARLHVHRLREVLGNPPIPTGACGDVTKKKKSVEQQPEAENEQDVVTQSEEDKKNELAAVQMAKIRALNAKVPICDMPLSVDLAHFYPSSVKNQRTLPVCVKSIVFSGYNPPPGPRKLAGDLFYVEVTTVDELVYHITCHVTGFYINKTTLAHFDPSPAKFDHAAHLLWDVLSAVSSSFRDNYQKLLKQAEELAQHGPLTLESILSSGLTVPGGKAPWMKVSKPTQSHGHDLNRAEDALCSSFGMEERGIIRDWNEEYQCCKELPHESPSEVLIRHRVLYKVLTEFVSAATTGAMAVIAGHIPPINPMDPTHTHVYVYNSIFFSKSVSSKDHLSADGCTEDTAYASAGHDIQGLLAVNQVDVKGLHTLATTIVDYLGLRIIAQSIIPGILQGEAASKLVYGSVDKGKTIASNPVMHELMKQVGSKLHLAVREMQPLGGDNPPEVNMHMVADNAEAGTDPVDICGPVEGKGILGSDGRHYILDLVRITPRDTTFYQPAADAAEKGLIFQRSQVGYTALLRPELLQLFTMHTQNAERKQFDDHHKDMEKKPLFEPTPVLFNPNVLIDEYPACTDPELVTKDNEVAAAAADYLQQVVIPAMLADFRQAGFSPVDGEALTEVMHSCGVNMRYLGRLATLATEHHLPRFLRELLEQEMIARVLKHVVIDMMSENPNLRAAPGAALIDLLNAVFGCTHTKDRSALLVSSDEESDIGNNKKKLKNKKMDGCLDLPTNGMDMAGIWKDIRTRVRTHFGYELVLWSDIALAAVATSETNQLHTLPLLRRSCQRLGLQLESKSYDFSKAKPFVVTDLAGIFPVVKSSLPTHPHPYAKRVLEAGRYQLSRGNLQPAYEHLQEAANILYQVCGSAHQDAVACFAALATVLFHAGDVAGALLQQQRALALSTQLVGVDHYETVFAHVNLAHFLHANGETDQAVKQMQRAIFLYEVIGGPKLPDLCTNYVKLGAMYQEIHHIQMALLCYRECLARVEDNPVLAANTLHQMALACSQVAGYRSAMTYAKQAYSLYNQLFGEKDARTLEASAHLSHFTTQAVTQAKGVKAKELTNAAGKPSAAVPVPQAPTTPEETEGFTPVSRKSKKSSKKN